MQENSSEILTVGLSLASEGHRPSTRHVGGQKKKDILL